MQSEQNDIIKEALKNKLQVLKAKSENGEAIGPDDRIHVAVLADSPTVVTGFGNVCREILTALHNTGLYDFEIVGINYDGSPHDLPFRIHPAINALMGDAAYRDPYGRQKFLDIIGEGRFDLIWVLQDTFIICDELGQKIKETNEALPEHLQFSSIVYFPIDSTPKKKWIDGSAMVADFPVVYTKYGYDEVKKIYMVGEDSKLEQEEKDKNLADLAALENKLSVVYHGINRDDFHELPAEDVERLRAQYWDTKKDKFVFINVNRNQPRKDLFRTMQAFKKLLDSRRAKGKDDVYLYLHCNVFDNNMNLLDMAKQLELVEGEEFAFPDPRMFGPSQGFPVSTVNELYNAADAVVTTTLGEGWGLSITEAMAVKRPILAPDQTSITEMLGKIEGSNSAERGILIKTKGDFVQQNDNARVRPLTDSDDLAEKMEFVIDNRTMIQPIVDAAYEWVSKLDWTGDEVMGKWREIFGAAYLAAIATRATQVDKMIGKQIKATGIGRNDDCPACPGIKFKMCRHGSE